METIISNKIHQAALQVTINELVEKGVSIFAHSVALDRMVELKNIGCNTMLVDMYTLKLISNN